MNVASLELCKELYELSGWYCGDNIWHYSEFNGLSTLAPADDDIGRTYKKLCPAYDLGYLLRKLQTTVIRNNVRAIGVQYQQPRGSAEWRAGYTGIYCYGGTPENALCKLAIELFKQGILKKESSDDPQTMD